MMWAEQVTCHHVPLIDIKRQSSQRLLYQPTYLGSVLFNGSLMQANSNYGCFMTFNVASLTQTKIPENLKVCFNAECDLAYFECISNMAVNACLLVTVWFRWNLLVLLHWAAVWKLVRLLKVCMFWQETCLRFKLDMNWNLK